MLQNRPPKIQYDHDPTRDMSHVRTMILDPSDEEVNKFEVPQILPND